MASRCTGSVPIFLSFLYPSAHISRYAGCSGRRATTVTATSSRPRRHYSSRPPRNTDELTASYYEPKENAPSYPESRLNPAPSDYAQPSFADKASLTLYAGPGGNGCISFLRDMFLPEGPPNGGDGGHGGNIYIQAVPGETSLHKIARRRLVRAGRGKHGMGSSKNGPRGDDVVLTVPVGTVVTEVNRTDPYLEDAATKRERYFAEKRRKKLAREAAAAADAAAALASAAPEGDAVEYMGIDGRLQESQRVARQKQTELVELDAEDEEAELAWLSRKWLVYPGLSTTEVRNLDYPKLPHRDRVFQQPAAPVYLDLSRPTPHPILLAVGGNGGLGNPHFVSTKMVRPVIATRGDAAVSMKINLELRLLADVGLVGLPNAGKSTLVRALTNSRARVGSWAFTTLQPNIGTVVLDNNRGRPVVSMKPVARPPSDDGDYDNYGDGDEPRPPRTRFTIADIPGLIEGAHMDKGLGIEFLRHVERAGVLAFVVDLGAGDAVHALKALWKEVGLYARLRDEEEKHRARESAIAWDGEADDVFASDEFADASADASPELTIAGKPWFVVGTKGDLPGAQENFAKLKAYMARVGSGAEPHPSGVEGGWTENLAAIPISAIKGHGVDGIVHWTVGLLDQ